MRVIRVSLNSLRVLTFSEFVQSNTQSLDYQVFEIQALESLCVWGLDQRLVSVVVDCMFGGQGKLSGLLTKQRPWTPIEQRIRQRIWESLSNAYETPWQTILPQRLHVLRQEQQANNLRLAQPESLVYAADFELGLNDARFMTSFCLPVSQQLQLLWTDPSETSIPQEAVWGRELRQQLSRAPLEATAIIARKNLTVGQLLEMTVGQVLPIDVGTEVDLEIEGRSMLSGRYGIKNNKYAVKVAHVFDELERLLDQQKMIEVELPPKSVANNSQGFKTSPLQSAAEALNDFDQQVATGGHDGEV